MTLNTPEKIIEHVVHCNPLNLSNLINVWLLLKHLAKEHFMGPTIERLKERTKLSEQEVMAVLASLAGSDNENTPIAMAICQEGTAGPHSYRFRRKENHTLRFEVNARDSVGFKIHIVEAST